MSVKIMVSYSDDKELQDVLKILKPITKKHKVARNKKGEYFNAYIEVKERKSIANTGV